MRVNNFTKEENVLSYVWGSLVSSILSKTFVCFFCGGGVVSLWSFTITLQSVRAQLLSRVRLFVTPWTVSSARLLCPWSFLARILEWVAISFSRESSRPRDQTCVSCVSYTGRQILHHSATWEAKNIFLTGNWTQAMAVRAPNSNHWTTRCSSNLIFVEDSRKQHRHCSSEIPDKLTV